ARCVEPRDIGPRTRCIQAAIVGADASHAGIGIGAGTTDETKSEPERERDSLRAGKLDDGASMGRWGTFGRSAVHVFSRSRTDVPLGRRHGPTRWDTVPGAWGIARRSVTTGGFSQRSTRARRRSPGPRRRP